MNKQEIKIAANYIEIKPENYTTKLAKVKIIAIRKHYEWNKKYTKQINFTYIYYSHKQDEGYPARNFTENKPLYLDGLVGCDKLTKFKSRYKLI